MTIFNQRRVSETRYEKLHRTVSNEKYTVPELDTINSHVQNKVYVWVQHLFTVEKAERGQGGDKRGPLMSFSPALRRLFICSFFVCSFVLISPRRQASVITSCRFLHPVGDYSVSRWEQKFTSNLVQHKQRYYLIRRKTEITVK